MSDLFIFYYRTITVTILGLLCGSFLNVCIYRLPRHESIAKGFSHCPHCQHRLAALDLVPLFSYLFLRARCRYCQGPIAARYAWIEGLTGFCFGLVAALWGSGRFSPAATYANRPAWTGPAGLYNGLIIGLVLLTFCALLVWAMIRADQNNPPRGLYYFIALPALLRLVLQPSKILYLAITALLLLLVFRLVIKLEPSDLAGLTLAAFWAGPAALLPALLLFVVLLAGQKKTSRASSWQPLLVVTCFLLLLFSSPLF